MGTQEITALAAAFESPFVELGRNAEADRGIVVVAWPSVPVEVIRAAGFAPVFARDAATPTPAADAVLEPGVFPGRIHQLFEAALTGRLAQVAAIVLPRTSDPDYKAYLYLKELQRGGTKLPPVLLFDLLQTGDAQTAAYNADRLRELSTQLTRIAGARETHEPLRAQLLHANAARAAARRLAALRAEPRVAGTAAMPLLGAFWQLPSERYCMLAGQAAQAIAARAPLDGSRVLLAGAPVDGTWLHAIVESLQGNVVAEATPFGSGAAAPDVDTTLDPFDALASWYATHVITARLDGATLAQQVARLLPGVDAAIVLLPPSDARFGWEYPRLRRLLDQHGIAHAVLQVEPGSDADEGSLQPLRALLKSPSHRQAVGHG